MVNEVVHFENLKSIAWINFKYMLVSRGVQYPFNIAPTPVLTIQWSGRLGCLQAVVNGCIVHL